MRASVVERGHLVGFFNGQPQAKPQMSQQGDADSSDSDEIVDICPKKVTEEFIHERKAYEVCNQNAVPEGDCLPLLFTNAVLCGSS